MRPRHFALLAIFTCSIVADTAPATVTTVTRSVDYSGSGTSTFTVTFGWVEDADIDVVKYTGSCGSATYTTLTQDAVSSGYTLTHTGAETGTVATTESVNSGYCLRISRTVDLTQETNFRAQGSFDPADHEDALDKLTHAVQQVSAGVTQSAETLAAIEDHIASSDDHTMYFKLAGRAGGQTGYGGTASGNDLVLQSNTSNDGTVQLASVLYADEATDRVGINNSSPSYDLDVTGDGYVSDDFWCLGEIYGSTSASSDLDLYSTSHLTKGSVNIAGLIDADENLSAVGIGGAADSSYLVSIAGDVALDSKGAAGEGYLYGSTAVDGDLVLSSTGNADKDKIYLCAAKTSAFDEENGRLGIGTGAPSYELHIVGDGYISSDLTVVDAITADDLIAPKVYGSGGTGNDMTLYSNSAGDGDVILGLSGVSKYDDANDALYIGSVDAKFLATLNVSRSTAGYVAHFWNEGDADADEADDGYYGVRISAGDTACVLGSGAGATSSTGCARYLYFEDGNGDYMGSISYVNATGSTAVVTASDARLKKNIADTDVVGLDVINRLKLRQFDWLGDNREHYDIGLVAQEVQEVWPSMVVQEPNGDLGIAPAALIPLLAKAVQELSAELEQLRSQQSRAPQASADHGEPAGPIGTPTGVAALIASIAALAVSLFRRRAS